MIINRSKNAIRNIGFGIISRIIGILGPFVVRTVFIHVLGAEYLGLNSLFSSILTILNLTELGFNSAIVFCMYKPISESDDITINALLFFYRKVYRIVGTIILGIGLCVIPILPFLISGSYPSDINITVVYVIFLLNTVVSYYLFAYFGALISAFQREDLISKIHTIITLVSTIIQVVVLLLVSNYYAYILTMVLFTIVNNICTALVAKKFFPQYGAKGELDQSLKLVIKEKIKGLVITKVCNVSRNAFDSIFISVFLGLSITAAYNNYYYIMSSVSAVTAIITSSLLAGVGNSVVIESVDKNYSDFRKMNFIYVWLGGWFSICLLCLYQPFMYLWVGDRMLLPFDCAVLFAMYFLVLKSGDILSIYIQATGMWWEMRYRSIAETIGNVLLNYFLGRFFGVQGIIVATMISMVVFGVYLSSRVIFGKYFGENRFKFFLIDYVKYIGVTILIGAIVYGICSFADYSIIGFIIKIIICVIFPNLLFLLIYRRTKIYKESMRWLKTKILSLKKN